MLLALSFSDLSINLYINLVIESNSFEVLKHFQSALTMAQIEILVDREDGSRFALNYNKQTNGNLFRYARAERLFGREEELRWRYESEYEGFFENIMAIEPEGEGGERRRINCDFVVDDAKWINLNLSSGKCTAQNTT